MQNKPRISRWIGGSYVLLFVLIMCLYTAIEVWTRISGSPAGIFFAFVMGLVLVLLAVNAYGFYKTVYVIRDGFLHSWSPFAIINLRLKDIRKIERTRIPFYFKGWGASLYSGLFYIPAFGWTKVIMTNMTDGVLITDRNGKHYLITPQNPDAFARLLK